MFVGLAHGFAVFALGVLLLDACTPAGKPTRLGLKLAPAALGTSVSLQQHLSVRGQWHNGELDAALEVDPQRLYLVGLALGQRVLSLQYDGTTLSSWRHPMLPAQLHDQDVLEDIQLTLWPIDAIRQALPAGWRIEETALRRTVFDNDTAVMVIDYSGAPRWNGTIKLANLRHHYQLTIQSVSNGP